MALGAQRSAVFTAILNEGFKLDLAGLLFGMALAFLLGHAMSGVLYGVSPFDPVAAVLAVALVGAVSFAALAAPARRAMHLDPAEALREE